MDIESGEVSSGYLYSISDSGDLYRGRELSDGGTVIEAYLEQSDTWVASPEDYISRSFCSGEFERISQDEAESIVDEAREARSQWSAES
ncbi:hypothetical protein [Rhodococcus sp. IEGM 1379]|uniref:hypothetical protein n=1 Tax=Rhodococcus sp. IEGM 1379 TaxID=3047086 RepID=UPI0024B76576|nr:hypothetical protein [Rhodococcus sp. IEGM 1379]MDI9919054.1 hypothetical protein [Rhodococcus sp. IEGM 1379]